MHDIEALRQIVDREIKRMDFATRKPRELYRPVDYIMSNGGKRLRPVLTLMACGLFTENIAPAVSPAVAIELFHNFTLLHDDIMDNAEIRRGKPTVHIKWNENTAILSGDAMSVISFDLISSAEPLILPQILQIFNSTAREVCEGQQMDMDFENMYMITEDEYLEMIRLKTSVLIAASMSIGALAGGASKQDSSLMYECGMNLGLAFQLQDDLLDLYGLQEEFGKKPGGDILMNKKTYLLVKTLAMADKNTADRINNLMSKEENPDKKIKEIRSIFDEYNISTITADKAGSYFLKAVGKLEETGSPPERKNLLIGFIQSIMKRKS